MLHTARRFKGITIRSDLHHSMPRHLFLIKHQSSLWSFAVLWYEFLLLGQGGRAQESQSSCYFANRERLLLNLLKSYGYVLALMPPQLVKKVCMAGSLALQFDASRHTSWRLITFLLWLSSACCRLWLGAFRHLDTQSSDAWPSDCAYLLCAAHCHWGRLFRKHFGLFCGDITVHPWG